LPDPSDLLNYLSDDNTYLLPLVFRIELYTNDSHAYFMPLFYRVKLYTNDSHAYFMPLFYRIKLYTNDSHAYYMPFLYRIKLYTNNNNNQLLPHIHTLKLHPQNHHHLNIRIYIALRLPLFQLSKLHPLNNLLLHYNSIHNHIQHPHTPTNTNNKSLPVLQKRTRLLNPLHYFLNFVYYCFALLDWNVFVSFET
jgi:hypothetical protein